MAKWLMPLIPVYAALLKYIRLFHSYLFFLFIYCFIQQAVHQIVAKFTPQNERLVDPGNLGKIIATK